MDADVRQTIRRSHALRTLGLALGGIMVGTVLRERGAPAFAWLVLAVYAIAWPHLACLWLRRSANPLALDRRLFLGDAAFGGAWIALMGFNLLPSAVLVTMFAMTLVMVDGWRMLLRGLVALLAACVVVALADGLDFAPQTSMRATLASLPLLTLFPTALAVTAHRLHRRMSQRNRQLARIGGTDSLSGLLNRMRWEETVDAALASRCCSEAAMLLIDIDRFKDINDRHGHTTGDEVVRLVGSVIRSSRRDGDIAGRYGGDEFALVLCGADLATAALVAERIRIGVAQTSTALADGLRCTLSIGLARCPPGATTARDWVQAADAALYRAKLAGRNRFALAG